MIVRNLIFDKLNKKEKLIVINHFNEQHKISLIEGQPFFKCENHKHYTTLNSFWEAHREADTNNGKYKGWKK